MTIFTDIVNLCHFFDEEEALFAIHRWSVVINDC